MTERANASRVELKLFGGPRVAAPDGPVRLSPSQLALITLVHAEPGIGRARVASILWREADDGRIRHRIRQLLHQVNRRIGLRVIQTHGDTLNPANSIDSDIASFHACLEANELLAAATLLEPGFAPLDLVSVGGAYRDWADGMRQKLERRLAEQAVERWKECTHSARWTEARDAAEGLYTLRPTDVQSVEWVIEARARVGRVGSAEAAYATYVDTLGSDRTPDAGVEGAIERARQVRRSCDDTLESASGPFVGREETMAEGRAVLDRVAVGDFAVFLVSGESGIGKTRLLAELERDALLRDFRAIRASPVELERRIPLNPLIDALKDIDLRPHLTALGKPWSTVISSTLPAGSYDELSGELPPIQESSLPRRLLDAFSMLLESLALEKPTVLFLDDLQWADATTVAALQFFQRRWRKGAFGIIASVRPELLEPGDPATKYLSGQEGLDVTRAELGELNEADAVRLIEGIAQGAIAPSLVRRLCEFAGLHPLYLTELTRDFLAGRLRLPDLPVDEVPIPMSLKQILRARIERLSEPATRIAGLLAVGARPMRLGDIAALSRMSLDATADHVDELEGGRLVRVRRNTVQISHDLFRSAIYNHLSEARRAVLHRAIAEHLLEGSGDVAPGELAIHFARAGDALLAAEYGWEAAARAWENGAMAEAAHFYEVVTENEQDECRRADATARQGVALFVRRNLERAVPILELATERLRESGRTSEARRVEIHRVEGLAAIAATPLPDLLDRLERIKSDCEASDDLEGHAMALNAELKLLSRLGDIPSINAVFEQMRSVAKRGSASASVLCYAGLAMQAMFADPADGLRSAEKAVDLAAPGSEHRLTALTRLLVVLQFQGHLFLPAVEGRISEARALAERSGDRWARFAIEGNLALALLDAGDVDRSAELTARTAEMLGTAEFDIPRFNLANNRAEIALATDDYVAAAAWYSLAEGCIEPNTPTYARDLVHAGIGLCALEMGNLSEARKREEALGRAPNPWFYDPTTILTFQARVLERRGNRTSAIELLERALSELRERHVFAWFKLGALRAKLLLRSGRRREARDFVVEFESRAAELNLPRVAARFSQLREPTPPLPG